MNYCPIMSSLGYVLSPCATKVLLCHRIGRGEDEQYGKYNGLGGHMEPNEDIASCMMRELREEAGIVVKHMCLRGSVNWTGFGDKEENWLAFIFLIRAFEGQPHTQHAEGSLAWHDIDQLHQLPMWEGDRYFLPLVFDADPRPFHGYLPYKNQKPQSWSFVRL